MYTVTLSGRGGTEKQARRALSDAGFTPLDPVFTADEKGTAFVSVEAEHPDQAVEAVSSLGWRLRAHHHTPPVVESAEEALRRVIREEIAKVGH